MPNNPFIVTGCGHSGTRYAAHLFNLEHESRETDVDAYIEAWKNNNFAREYVENNEFGRESSPFIAPLTKEIRRKYPNATIIQLVRDPREAVRSQLVNGIYKRKELHNNVFFGGRTRLEKACWYWVKTNEFVRKYASFVRLEDLGGKPIGKSEDRGVEWPEWTARNKKTLIKICGKEALNYGYEIEG